ncbi:MAG: FecR/PupR family sigma factor regulator [Pseudomonadales bacterium]
MSHSNSPAESASRQSPPSALGDEQAVAWFVRLNGQDVTDSQRMAFNRWLGLDPEHRRSYQAVLTLWQRLAPQVPPRSWEA